MNTLAKADRSATRNLRMMKKRTAMTMRKRVRIVLSVGAGVFILCSASKQSSAEEPKKPLDNHAQDTCAGENTEQAMLLCHRRHFEASEKNLEDRFEKLRKHYAANEPKLIPLLVAAQTAWENHKAADCKVDTYYSMGGSAHEIYWLDCLSKQNNRRAAYYADLLGSP